MLFTIVVLLLCITHNSNGQTKFNRNIPDDAHKAISNTISKGITTFSFTPTGGWVLVTKTGRISRRNIPAECEKTVKEFLAKGHKIQHVAFPPKGGNSWIIVTDKTTFSRNIPGDCHKKIQEFQKRGKKIKLVAFPPKAGNSWVILNTDGSFFARNIDDECYQILRNLRQSEMPGKKAKRKITHISFAPNGGFVVLAEDYHFTRNINNECFSKMNSFRNGKNMIHSVVFNPKGKGWSIISNTKIVSSPKDKIRIFESNVGGKGIWKRMRELNVPGASVGVVINGKLAWSTAYGHLKKGKRTHAVHPESMFQAASVSKVIAAIGAFKMAEVYPSLNISDNLRSDNSLLSINIPVHKDNSNLKGIGNVSIKTILEHTSGINIDGYDGYKETVSKVPTLNQIIVGRSQSGKAAVNSSPISLRYADSDYRYSGASFTILQKLTEDVTKKEYSLWMKSNVLDKMGMKQSNFTIHPEKIYAKKNLTYGKDNTEIYRHPEYAAAGLYTNVNELSNVVITLNNLGKYKGRSVISNSSAKSIANGTGAKTTDGKVEASNSFYNHGGTNNGYMTFLIGFKDLNGKDGITKAGIVVLTNGSSRQFRYDLVNAITKAYGW